MSKTTLIVVLLGASIAYASPSTPTLVQGASHSGSQGNTVTAYCPFWANQSLSGNLILAMTQWNTAGTAPVVKDNNNTYTTAVSSGEANQTIRISYSANVAAGVVGTTSTYSTANNFVQMQEYEFAGMATSSPLDVWCGVTALAGLNLKCSMTTATSGDLVICTATQDGNATSTQWKVGPAFTMINPDSNDNMVTFYGVQSVAGSTSPVVTMSQGTSGSMVCAAFKPAAAGNTNTGAYIVNEQHEAMTASQSSANMTFQTTCPSSANSIILQWVGSTATGGCGTGEFCIVGATSSVFGPFTQRGSGWESTDGQSGILQTWDISNLTCTGSSDTITLAMIGTPAAGATLIIDYAANLQASPYDSTAGIIDSSGTQLSAGTLFTSTITPTNSGELCFSQIGVNSNSVHGPATPGNFYTTVPTPEPSNSPMDENNGWQASVNTPTSSNNFQYASLGGAVNSWASTVLCYKAAAAAAPTSQSTKMRKFEKLEE